MIRRGDNVVAVMDPGTDRKGRPEIAPRVGEVYTVTRVYSAPYGLGCCLEGLNPRPYRGYLLRVDDNRFAKDHGMRPGLYFRKVEPVDIKSIAARGAPVKKREKVDA